jgi:hypothetical protein
MIPPRSWLLAALLLGCGPGSSPDVPPDPETLLELPAVPFEEASFPCCGSDRVRLLVVEYLDLQQALGRDDLARAHAELEALHGAALAAAGDDALSGHSRGLARQVAGLLEPVAGGSLDALRDAFSEVSNRVIVLAQANRGGSKPLAVAYCVRSNANWLQAGPDILNPYLGSVAPSSGSFRR